MHTDKIEMYSRMCAIIRKLDDKKRKIKQIPWLTYSLIQLYLQCWLLHTHTHQIDAKSLGKEKKSDVETKPIKSAFNVYGRCFNQRQHPYSKFVAVMAQTR